MQASYTSYTLEFDRPAGTSRGVLHRKQSWFVKLTGGEVTGIGEVSFFPGLSVEDPDEIEHRIGHVCRLISRGEADPRSPLPAMPGLQFALETALLDLDRGGTRMLYPSEFTRGQKGIPINGLIWMGDRTYMLEQIRTKLESGFRVLKMKVGALDPEQEYGVLARVRREYSPKELEIRLDANGAWSPEEAPEKLKRLSGFGIHSIEQPISPGQTEAMAALCAARIIPVALDEELIGLRSVAMKSMIEAIRPSFIILKPGLLGGFSVAREWIRLAAGVGAGWWVTSALESNVGLSAIAQWVSALEPVLTQGLGTGRIYRNNIPSPLEMEGDRLWYRPEKEWDLSPVLEMNT
ncbi:MAG: o-succinylbenzoate synthase [Bacteroidales bacterium]